MNSLKKAALAIPVVLGITLFLSSFIGKTPPAFNPVFKMPYRQAGLTDRQAAAHLLERFTFGASPEQVDAVVQMGLENWFEQQLKGGLNEDELKVRLKDYDALAMNNDEVLKNFPKPGKILREAVKDGMINKDSANNAANKAEYRKQLQDYLKSKGLKPEQELYRQFINQKIIRAAYSPNQMQEVLTDFWFNHFNVSITKNDCAEFIPAYERDVIRPNVTGKFYDMLLATAQSPAMLYYLDNFSSAGKNSKTLQMDAIQDERLKQRMETMDPNSPQAKQIEKRLQQKKQEGLNENYAREIMELHTLGVDGGYTQKDVTEAARVLTGWTVYPYEDQPGAQQVKNAINRFGENNLEKMGFVHKGDFMFAVNRHDDGQKTVLGKNFPSGGGYQEGLDLIYMLAHHPSTAKFISKEIAMRFVSDSPPQSLIDKMAQSFQRSDGDLKEVLKTMVAAPEFWNKDAIRSKTKSPFELAISVVRDLKADVKMPFLLYQWITKMGEKYYYYQAPTGFPDRAQYWINTGSLLYRMNFGLAFASEKIPGVSFDLAGLNDYKEPESAEAALETYAKILLPERNLDETIKRLIPIINDPEIQKKIEEATVKTKPAPETMNENGDMMNQDEMTKTKVKFKDNPNEERLAKQELRKNGKGVNGDNMPVAAGNNTMLGQVVGIILGSPEFQRR